MKVQKRTRVWFGVSMLIAGWALGAGCSKKNESTDQGETAKQQAQKKLGGAQDKRKKPETIDETKTTRKSGRPAKTVATRPAAPAAPADGPKVLLRTSMGDIVVQLNPKKAPITVKNFLRYVKEGFYDGTMFHRVISHFMIQGGGWTPDFKKKPTHEPIKNEADNGLKNLRGTIAMARTRVVDSATAQFFINVKDNPALDHRNAQRFGYAVFGKVIKGMDVVDKIRNVETGPGGPFTKDCPQTKVLIKEVKLIADETKK
jgi:cyclophilin family peptidyl-prolyl cis-trans isomerase